MDVLNPIQTACIDPAWLKRTYGDRLCFWNFHAMVDAIKHPGY